MSLSITFSAVDTSGSILCGSDDLSQGCSFATDISVDSVVFRYRSVHCKEGYNISTGECVEFKLNDKVSINFNLV